MERVRAQRKVLRTFTDEGAFPVQGGLAIYIRFVGFIIIISSSFICFVWTKVQY